MHFFLKKNHLQSLKFQALQREENGNLHRTQLNINQKRLTQQCKITRVSLNCWKVYYSFISTCLLTLSKCSVWREIVLLYLRYNNLRNNLRKLIILVASFCLHASWSEDWKSQRARLLGHWTRSRAGHLRYFRLERLLSIQKNKCPALKLAFFWTRTTKQPAFCKKWLIENGKNIIFLNL